MFTDIVKSAIHEKKELLLKVKSGTESGDYIEVFMQPYVYGNDVLQYEFIWGYLAHNHVFYKILTNWIVSAETIEIPYTVLEGTEYEYASGEEHFCILEGLHINYADAGSFV